MTRAALLMSSGGGNVRFSASRASIVSTCSAPPSAVAMRSSSFVYPVVVGRTVVDVAEPPGADGRRILRLLAPEQLNVHAGLGHQVEAAHDVVRGAAVHAHVLFDGGDANRQGLAGQQLGVGLVRLVEVGLAW